MLKRCGTCKEEKPKRQFYINRQKPDGRQSKCKECQKLYHNNSWYIKNRESVIKKMRARKLRIRRINYKKILEIYFSDGCVDCGTKDARVLEFDHVRGKKKHVKSSRGAGIAYLVRDGYKWSTIKKEIDKCDVRCRNCHQIRTREQFLHHQDVMDILQEYQEKMELSSGNDRYRCSN
tara:strand:+ start:219 stop:749 length:531 start_codon:yes stop_codon:yes gene_type:complete